MATGCKTVMLIGWYQRAQRNSSFSCERFLLNVNFVAKSHFKLLQTNANVSTICMKTESKKTCGSIVIDKHQTSGVTWIYQYQCFIQMAKNASCILLFVCTYVSLTHTCNHNVKDAYLYYSASRLL